MSASKRHWGSWTTHPKRLIKFVNAQTWNVLFHIMDSHLKLLLLCWRSIQTSMKNSCLWLFIGGSFMSLSMQWSHNGNGTPRRYGMYYMEYVKSLPIGKQTRSFSTTLKHIKYILQVLIVSILNGRSAELIQVVIGTPTSIMVLVSATKYVLTLLRIGLSGLMIHFLRQHMISQFFAVAISEMARINGNNPVCITKFLRAVGLLETPDILANQTKSLPLFQGIHQELKSCLLGSNQGKRHSFVDTKP